VFHALLDKFGILKQILADALQDNIGLDLAVYHALMDKFGILKQILVDAHQV
jgi:hypothetical protein